MREILIAALLLVSGAGLSAGLTRFNVLQAPSSCVTTAELVISPGAGPEMVRFLDQATRTIEVGLFEFSSADLKAAIRRARQRGVDIRVLLDAQVSQNVVAAEFLALEGVQVKWAPRSFNYYHQKVALVDGKDLLIGSTNWSNSALVKNREADVIFHSPDLAKEWLETFEKDWKEGLPVTRAVSASR